jgi:hypothetical protein
VFFLAAGWVAGRPSGSFVLAGLFFLGLRLWLVADLFGVVDEVFGESDLLVVKTGESAFEFGRLLLAVGGETRAPGYQGFQQQPHEVVASLLIPREQSLAFLRDRLAGVDPDAGVLEVGIKGMVGEGAEDLERGLLFV